MNITIAVPDGDAFPIEIAEGDNVASLKEKVEFICGLPSNQQRLLVNGHVLSGDSSLLCMNALSDGDVVFVMPLEAHQGSTGPSSSAPSVADMMAQFSDPGIVAQLRQTFPELAVAITTRDLDAFAKLIKQLRSQKLVEEQLPDDPMDPEYQRRMLERIEKQNIEDNYQAALEHSPEVFGQIDMLYTNMSVNGEPLKAFIDSGAQMTIMTSACAEKCNLMRLVDKRYAGLAIGVGSSKMLGRIHACALRVDEQYITTAISVLEQNSGPQFIFGLDNLRRHQCAIDLKREVLVVGSCGVELPFLPVSEIPLDFNLRRQRPEGQADELDRAGSVPNAVDGNPAAAEAPSSISNGLPGQPEGHQHGEHSPTHAPNTAAGNAQKLRDLTGKSAEECTNALELAGGDIEAAASNLMGFD